MIPKFSTIVVNEPPIPKSTPSQQRFHVTKQVETYSSNNLNI